MSIAIYTSRQSKGNNPAREAVLDLFVSAYNNTKFNKRRKIFVITPKQDTYQVERELIERVGKHGLLGVQITDFETFIRRMIDEEASNLEVVDSHGRLMIIQKALLDIEEKLSIYKSSIREPNFKSAILNQITELKQAQITPELLNSQLDKLGDSLLKSKLQDLSYILESFNNNLGENHYDEADLINLSLQLISDSTFLNDVQLFVVDENNLSYNEVLFFTQADKKVKDINIAINTDQEPTVPDASAFTITNQVLKLFRALSQEYGADLEIIDLPLKKGSSSLDFLAQEFFSYYPKKYHGKELNVGVYKGKNPWDEVTQVAQLILKDNQAGIPLSQIAVASNNPSEYDPIVKRVFSQYGIPYFIDENHKVIDNHFIQAVLSALDTINSNFNRADILSYLKSEFSGLTPEQSDLIENYIIEAGIRPFEWKKPFKRVPRSWRLEQKEFTEEDEVVKIQNKILKNLKPLLSIGKKKLTVREYINLLEKFLLNSKSQERLEELAEEVSQAGQEELSVRYRQIWNILQENLEQMENALGNEKLSLNDFITILKSGISSYEVGVIPEDNEAVIISSLDRTRLPQIKNLYFLGLNEELVPMKQGDEMLLTDYDKELIIKLFDIPNQLIKNKEFIYELEENNLYSLLTKPENKVIFTYHSYTTAGEEAFPSRYLDILFRIFDYPILLKPAKFFNLLSPSRASVILENFVNDTDYKVVKSIIQDWFKDNKAESSISLFSDLPLKPQDTLKSVDAKELYQIVDDKNRVSISRLENFASCPFKHFIDYGIRLHDREEFEVRSFDTGIIIHEIFNEFLSKMLNETNKNPKAFREKVNHYIEEDKAFNKEYETVFSQALDKLEEVKRYNHTAASRYLINKLKRVCKLALKIILEQLRESDYMPVELEQYFWDRRDDGIVVEGRIDRIDLKQNEDSQTVRVIDYKTSKRSVEYIDLLYGQALQLSIYLLEALKRFDKTTDAKGSFYFITRQNTLEYSDALSQKIKDQFKMNGINRDDGAKDKDLVAGKSQYSPSKLTQEELDMLLNHSSGLIKSLTNSLSEGNISVNPMFVNGEEKSCRFCNYKDICRFNPNNEEYSFKKLNKINKDSFFEKISQERENE